MNFYERKILPYFLDLSLSAPSVSELRREVLKDVTGEVLEIGFGTGLNLPFYPERVRKITTVDPNPGVQAIAQKRIAASPITVEHRVISGEQLPLEDASFDSVVSTFTLCSIPDVEQALSEIYRVLKPGGRFFFVEHGLSNEPNVQIWQNRLTPIQKRIAGGCHFNRNMRSLIENEFDQTEIQEFYSQGEPKFVGYLYQGVAWKG